MNRRGKGGGLAAGNAFGHNGKKLPVLSCMRCGSRSMLIYIGDPHQVGFKSEGGEEKGWQKGRLFLGKNLKLLD